VPHLGTLAEAVWEARRVAISYTRGDRLVDRIIEPLGLILKGGTWYVIGSTDGQIRTYRASRVAAAALTEERFERPANFELATYWAESSAAYEREVPRVAVTVRIHPDRIPMLEDLAGTYAVRTAERLEPPGGVDPDGWIHLRLRIDWPHEVPSRLVGVGSDMEVLAPEEVRAKVQALAAGVVARYAASVARSPAS
jgi:predicted DNA-binding transcriptional regulator YafY